MLYRLLKLDLITDTQLHIAIELMQKYLEYVYVVGSSCICDITREQFTRV